MMSTQSRKLSGRKCKSSIVFCQEKYACSGENTEAEFRCEECNTLQCGACESNLHQVSKFVFHDRKRIILPPQQKLCQFSCQDRNFANLICENCDIRFCFHCYDKVHVQGKRKQHKTRPVESEKVKSVEQSSQNKPFASGLESEINRPMLSNNLFSPDFDPVKPSSPIAPGDDTLTYYSVPQMEAGTDLHLSNTSNSSKRSLPDITADIGLAMTQDGTAENETGQVPESKQESFLLIDSEEKIQLGNEEDFLSKLGCKKNDKLKTISIFGNTGDGKSHTLNHVFFEGREVFKTSPEQDSCTVGVWCAYDAKTETVLLDTEGLLGISSNANKRTRLLLKVLAVSDIIIYRTRAERIHNDMFRFLADASKAYLKHFSAELRGISEKLSNELLPVSNLGPAVIIFHQTSSTNLLGNGKKEAAVKILKDKFKDQKLTIDAFCGLSYVGAKSPSQETIVKELQTEIKRELRNNSIRSPRRPGILFKALKALNDKFSGDIEKTLPSTFPDQYFRCRQTCRSCNAQCSLTMNHLEHEQHFVELRCQFRDEFENQVYFCKACYKSGSNEMVVPKTSSAKEGSWLGLAKYAWAGYVLECKKCGIIYRSRQYWYGNEEPVRNSVRTEIRHVWPEGNPVLGGTHNAARRLLDGFQYVADCVSGPTNTVNKWVADQIRPEYWRPNSEILECKKCQCSFSDPKITLHHCRFCGEGFCEECSQKRLPVPERGWGDEKVRVCDSCYDIRMSGKEESDDGRSPGDPTQIRARKVGEIISNTLGAVVGPAVNYPLGVIRDSAKPTYWVPDNEIKKCDGCNQDFGPKLAIHHCRACGQGVCDPCSQHRLEVPTRGWDHKVRVCTKCAQQDQIL